MDASNTFVPLQSSGPLSQLVSINNAAAMVIFLTVLYYLVGNQDTTYSGFKLVNKEKGEWSNKAAKERWAKNSVEVVKKGFAEVSATNQKEVIRKDGSAFADSARWKTGGKPFQVITGHGPAIILPIGYLDDIKGNENLSLVHSIRRELYTYYPGLEVLETDDSVLTTVIRQKLTQALGGLTTTLSTEAGILLEEELGKSDGWTDVKFTHVAESIAARLSCLVFMGKPLCHDKAWLDISVSYLVNCMRTVRKIETFHPLLRPLVYRFLPEARLIQAQLKLAKAIIEPEITARRKAHHEARLSGKPCERNDSVTWFEDLTQGKPYDYVSAQLTLTTAAIHTTSSTILIIMYDIMRNPELIPALREEAVRVLREDGGWKKTTLYKMRLLDSVMKESIRITTATPFSMRRYATKSITLSDGTRIPKGAYLLMSNVHLLNPSNFGDNGDKFDGYRFLKLRQQPGEEHRWQFVTTGQDNMRFGHGTHACPGRFFAANEIKIAITHLLLKYDWRFKGAPPKGRSGEYAYSPDPNTVVQFKSRQSEIDL